MEFPTQKMLPILLPVFLVIALLLFVYQVKKDDVSPEDTQVFQDSNESESLNASSSDSISTTTDVTPVLPTKKVTPTTPSVSKTNTPPSNTLPVSGPTTKELQPGDYVNEMLANSRRCEWVDPSNGEENLVFIKDGKIRLETTKVGGTIIITIYNAIGRYVWTKGEERGTLILNGVESVARSKSELATFLTTSSRVKCESTSLSDSHFIPPKDVTFL